MARFDTTNWSLISQARRGQTRLRGAALQQLLEAYLPALNAYLVYDKRLQPEYAADILQGFVLKHVLEGNLIHNANREGGRFRTWLIRWLENYLRNESRKQRRERTLDDDEAALQDLRDAPRTATAFEAAWARTVLSETLSTMELECRREGNEKRWTVFSRRVVAPCLGGASPPGYRELAAELRLEKEQTQNLLVTAKRQFQRLLETVIGCYELSEQETELELADLRRIVSVAPDLELWNWQSEPGTADSQDGPPGASMPSETMRSVMRASTSQVSRLFELDSKAQWTRLLRTPLGELPVGPLPVDTLPAAAGRDKALTLGDLLVRDSDLGCLKAVKKYAEQIVEEDQEEPSVEVGLGLYFLAIAAAQVRLEEAITRTAPDLLRLGYERLLKSGWLDDRSRELVEQACRRVPRS